MNWKILFLLFLVSLIGTIFVLNRERFQTPKLDFITGLVTRIWKTTEKKIVLTILETKTPLSFSVAKETITLNGVCIMPVKIGKTTIHLTNYLCSFKFYEPSGKITINKNSISFEVTSKSLEINEIFYQTEEKIVGEILANSGSLFIASNNIKIEEIEGKLEIYTVENKPSLILNFPPCEYLELNSFNGEVKITNGSIVFDGSAIGKYRCQNVENKI